MIILVLKVLSAISLVPFLFISYISLLILLRLPRAQMERGIPSWEQLALVGNDGSVKPASDLVKHFKKRAFALPSAILVIAMGFALPYFSPESIKDLNLFYYMTFGLGLGGGWPIAFGCMYYSNLVSWNIFGVKAGRR